ncbi:glycoside hydrolase family 53 protein [Dinghuibacter silviterrae]|uniref:Arabinogalactan endo-beta-1,4-galactanase n=1 Tax=Dinghuibacter silviterrae TaxID=1539049 RepID=A0A4R8DI41_9BACT|nr:glycosyl hydrolase 53 family protein [Dinghuibacter silviterrae]TDW97215.1 arabinogalactan endo-1,4-beta-galactosidase [Dinghuibacter silviterrae]
MIRQTIACLFVLICALSCSKNNSGTKTTTTTSDTPDASASSFANGADVSWVTQMEASGYKFYNSSGTQEDLFAILGGLGINSIRLRVWVNPSGGWCNTADVLAKAKRAKAAGMNIMIDFHYSDTWADPGHQTVPAAWAGLDFTGLMNETYNYTLAVLDTLKAGGITPTWVQVGNEVSNGMLWPDGEASLNMKNFAWLVNCGYNATKAVFPNCKVIVHLANGYDNTTFRWLFDGLKSNGASWDVIGMSLYPTTSNYTTLDAECLSNMQDMVSRYGKQVMICEVGMEEDQPTITEAFLKDIIAKTKSVSGGLGVFYWEPECYNNWQGYGLGAFGSNGEPTAALSAF